jgi:DNA polymerase-3 subunit alpha
MAKILSVTPASSAKITPERAGELFDLIDKFSGYGFNKSHAAAYALLTWQSSWLKLHHPAAFYASALTYNDADFDKMRKIIREARERGVVFLPPSINESDDHFTPETTADGKPAVRWGLGSIKGVGSYARPLAAACRGRGFKRIEDVAKAMTAQGNATGPIRALAAAGAFDALNSNRNAAAEHFILCLKEEGKQTGQDFLFAIASPACPDVPDMTAEEKRHAEIESIGISFHEHPLSSAWSEVRRLSAVSINRLDEYVGCGAVTVLARVEGISKSPRGTTVYARLSDATGEIEAVVEMIPSQGEIIVAELARKASEPRWRLVEQRRFSASSTPQRMRVDIKASHDWEKLRKQLISTGRGDDRIDIMIDLGEKKMRKVLPPCFVVTPELEKLISSNPDVISTKVF